MFAPRNVRAEHKGIETQSYLGPKFWAKIPPDIKRINDILIFKRKIRPWKADKCR